MGKLIWKEPKIMVENFEPNEYVAACNDIESVACLNMGERSRIATVFSDKNMNGIIDDDDVEISQLGIRYNYMNDCGMTGDTVAGNHPIANLSLDKDHRVIVKYNNGTIVPAVMDYSYNDGNTPHFVSLKNVNHS